MLASVKASVLADKLGLGVMGPDATIASIEPVSRSAKGSLSFATRPVKCANGSIVFSAIDPGTPAVTWIATPRPRLTFAKALHVLEQLVGFERGDRPAVHTGARISSRAHVGRNVTIGSRTTVESFARIAPNTVIGADCWIKSGAVIGEDGYGFERDEDGTPIRLLHFGGVRIGNRVEIGSLTTVCQGTLDPTVIEDDVKIDDHVHVAHNVTIHKKAMVIAHAELSGGVVVGEQAWIAPRACVREQITIGRKAVVGLGAVVVRNVADEETVAGNPAKPLSPNTLTTEEAREVRGTA